MRTSARIDPTRIPTSPPSRSPSITDGPTSPKFASLMPSPMVTPLPAYVAVSLASEEVYDTVVEPALAASSLREAHMSEDQYPVVSEGATAMINAFLDQLLYNFLQSARSADLPSLRIAVERVLKGKLARQAIAAAEDEADGYMTDAEHEEELAAEHDEQLGPGSWDTDLIWRRTRLKVMAYCTLSEMEDEDEEQHVEEQQLHGRGENLMRQSPEGLGVKLGLVFLASILEYVAKQCITSAGHSAYERMTIRRVSAENDGIVAAAEPEERLIVREQDAERLALSSSLGRIWRTWRKNSRNSKVSPSMRGGRWSRGASLGSLERERRSSQATNDTSANESKGPGASDALGITPRASKSTLSEEATTLLSNTRPTSDQTGTRRPRYLESNRRSRSFVRFPVVVSTASTFGSWQPRASETNREAARESPRENTPMLKLKRSNSLPTPDIKAFTIPAHSTLAGKHASIAVVQAPVVHQPEAKSEVVADQTDKTAPVDQSEQDVQEEQAGPGQTDEEAGQHTKVEQAEQHQQSTQPEQISQPDPSEEAEKPAPAEQVEKVQEVEQEHKEPDAVENALPTTTERPGAVAALGYHADTSQATSEAEDQRTSSRVSQQQSADDDEYDPFKADMPTLQPPRAKRSRDVSPASNKALQPQANHAAGDGSRVSQDAMAALAGGAVSAAILGSTRQKSKFQSSSNRSETLRNLDGEQAAPLPQSAVANTQDMHQGPAVVQPTLTRETPAPAPLNTTSARHLGTDGSQPVTSTLSRNPGSATSSNYVTPPRSPTGETNSGKLPKESTAQDDKTRQSPRSRMAGFDSAGQRKHKTSIDANDSPRSAASFGAHSISTSEKSEKEFQDVVRGNGTVKRSLTPKNLIEIERPDSLKARQDNAGPAPSPVAEAFDVSKASDGPKTKKGTRSSVHPGTGGAVKALALPQAREATRGPRFSSERNVIPSEPKSPVRPTPTQQKPTSGGKFAREARVQTEPTFDMADYLRSTAPGSDPLQKRPVPSATTVATATGSPALQSTKPTASISSNPASRTPSLNYGSRPSDRRSKLLEGPRAARVERQRNDELISFLRDGPPGAHVGQASPLDSLGLSQQNRSSSQTSQSYNESVHTTTSHSGLLSKRSSMTPSNEQRGSGAQTAARPAPSNAEGLGGPVRKQRRVKDPFAIDSDDEGDILTGLPAREQGESLMDFLRNAEPPPSDSTKKLNGTAGKRSSRIVQTGSAGSKQPATARIIPSNDEISAAPPNGTQLSGDALPEFLRDSRATSTRTSIEGNPRKLKNRPPSKSGMRSFFRRIGVNG